MTFKPVHVDELQQAAAAAAARRAVELGLDYEEGLDAVVEFIIRRVLNTGRASPHYREELDRVITEAARAALADAPAR